LAGIALSKFGLMPDQFLKLTPRQFSFALDDAFKKEERRERFELEKMRLQTFHLVNIQLDRKNKISDIRKLMPFAWEKVKVHVPTAEDWERMDNIVKKCLAKQSTN
jgi:hypothetical protein